jgi:CO dehydrogenase maturation factor
MAEVIVSTGRGGTGKSTFCAIISRYLAPPLLLIDVDPDQSLCDMLGVDLAREGVSTVSSVVSDISETDKLGSRLYFDELEASFCTKCVYRSGKFDIVTLGTKWAEGCYCRADNYLKGIIPKLAENYSSVVIDSPAGLEHLNRRVVSHINDVFVLSDPSLKSAKHIERMKRIIDEVKITYDYLYLVGSYEFNAEGEECLRNSGEEFLGKIDYDVNVRDYNLKGKSLWDLPEDSPACLSVKKLLKRIREIGRDHFQVREELFAQI